MTKYILPIKNYNGFSMSSVEAKEIGENLSGEYCISEPYPHIVLENFIPIDIIENIIKNFPKERLSQDIIHNSGLMENNKRQIYPYECSRDIKDIFNFFNSADFLVFLESLTRIEGLIPDPYYFGGGLHEISTGGKLGIHADFRLHEKLKLKRRLNVLIYLNKDWDENYGGKLEIWDKGVKKMYKSISPILNRCVIFNTDEGSYHGHPEPLMTPIGVTRKSIALYYYTAEDNNTDVPQYSTIFHTKPGSDLRERAAAFISRMRNYLDLKEILPPIIYRNIRFIYRKYLKK